MTSPPIARAPGRRPTGKARDPACTSAKDGMRARAGELVVKSTNAKARACPRCCREPCWKLPLLRACWCVRYSPADSWQIPYFNARIFLENKSEIAIEALMDFEKHSPRQAEVVWLRFVIGLNISQTAIVLGVLDRTVIDDWKFARASLLASIAAE